MSKTSILVFDLVGIGRSLLVEISSTFLLSRLSKEQMSFQTQVRSLPRFFSHILQPHLGMSLMRGWTWWSSWGIACTLVAPSQFQPIPPFLACSRGKNALRGRRTTTSECVWNWFGGPVQERAKTGFAVPSRHPLGVSRNFPPAFLDNN